MRVVVYEDSPLVRERLIGLLCGTEHEVLTAGPVDGRVIDDVLMRRPEAVILSTSTADGAWLEIIREMREASPSMRIIALCSNPCPECEQRCLDTGATAHLDKANEFHRILEFLADTPVSRG